ncbi:MAG: hypothetical protein E6R14_03995 [Thermomicrobiales bacterium]|nr:MAG: hypothetical protein E6R14_03995 [Thermomicrobiales bacterium]
MSDSAFREQEARREQEFLQFEREHGAAFRRAAPAVAQASQRLLVVSSGSLGLLVEIALVKAIQAAGYRPVILTDYDRWVDRYYRAAGVEDVVYWEEWQQPVSQTEAAVLMNSLASFEQFIQADYCGARVGKYAASTGLRHLRVGRLDLSIPSMREALLPFLHRAMSSAQAAQTIVATFKPDLVLSVDPGYTPRGELFDACLAAGIDTITWNAAHKNNSLMLKRYRQANRDVHPASLSSDTWRELKSRPWTEAERERLHQELVGSYQRGEWYSEVGTQFHTANQDTAEVRRALALDDGKKTAVIFPHIFWDGTFFYGTDLFESYEEWFVESMKVACANHEVNWIVKIHPANLVKNARDGSRAEPSELAALRSLGDALPSHVRILPPDSRMSTLSLYSVMDYCVTVRGTVGIEAASFGVPVFTAGTGRYDHRGFTIDSDTRAQYLDRLRLIHETPPLSADQRNLAERFAYGIFLARPFSLRSVTMEFQRDAKVSLHSTVHLPKGQDPAAAPDLRLVTEWVHSGAEDFLSPLP